MAKTIRFRIPEGGVGVILLGRIHGWRVVKFVWVREENEGNIENGDRVD